MRCWNEGNLNGIGAVIAVGRSENDACYDGDGDEARRSSREPSTITNRSTILWSDSEYRFNPR